MFPKKNPIAHSSGLSRDSANAAATTLLDSNTQEPTGRTTKERPFEKAGVTEVDATLVAAQSADPDDQDRRAVSAHDFTPNYRSGECC